MGLSGDTCMADYGELGTGLGGWCCQRAVRTAVSRLEGGVGMHAVTQWIKVRFDAGWQMPRGNRTWTSLDGEVHAS